MVLPIPSFLPSFLIPFYNESGVLSSHSCISPSSPPFFFFFVSLFLSVFLPCPSFHHPLLHDSSLLFILSNILPIFKYPSLILPVGTSLSLLTEGHIAFSTENNPPQPPTPPHPTPNASKLTWERHLWSHARHHGTCSFVVLSSCFALLHIDPSLLQSLSSLFHLIPFFYFFATSSFYEPRFQSSQGACYSKFPRGHKRWTSRVIHIGVRVFVFGNLVEIVLVLRNTKVISLNSLSTS